MPFAGDAHASNKVCGIRFALRHPVSHGRGRGAAAKALARCVPVLRRGLCEKRITTYRATMPAPIAGW